VTEPTAVQRLAGFAVAVRDDGLPAPLAHQAARHVRDLLGIALAAGVEWPEEPVSGLVARWGGIEEAAVLGRGGRAPAANAALVGGTLAHALDFDDTHLPSVLHPSASVVPAALAAGEAAGAGGAAFLAAVAAGNEIACRAGMAGYDEALGNSIFFERGLHATAICGALGAAAAAALLAGLDEAGVAHAVAIATSLGAGLLEANRTGGTVKRAHCGWAAHAGVTAAELAGAGLTGPPTALEGRFGFLYAFCGEGADPAALTDGLGERWEVDRLHVKPYPTNHFTHAGIDAALELRARGLAPEDVEEAQIGVAPPVLRTIAEPPEVKAAPPTGYAARFSAPFTFAAALHGGGGLGVFLDDFTDERAADPGVLALAAKVSCVPDARCAAIFPHEFPAVVRVRTAGGGEEQVEVLANRGGPQRPLSDAELRTKFRACAERALDDDRIVELDAALERVEDLDDLGALTRPAARDAAAARG
jgi:2-methylcitrate dehydratase PrpD